MSEKTTLEYVVNKAGELPALPQVAAKVLHLTNNPDSTIDEISRLITTDQVLTARILRLANSAYYGFTRKISSVSEALVILGLSVTRTLILASSVAKVMNKEVAGYALGKGELWKHSIVSAVAARTLANKVGYPDEEKAFTAGLMHDIGKIVMNTYIGPQIQKVVAMVESQKIPFMTAEEKILGFNHAQVGGRIARKWNLPEELAEAIYFHHEPHLADKDPKLTAIAHVADAACMVMGVGIGGDGLLYPVEDQALQILKVDIHVFDQLIAEVADHVHNNEDSLLVG